MCNFNPGELEYLWSMFGNFVATHYNVGRGRRSDVSGKDAFLMVLTVLKYGGDWHFLAKLFGKKVPTFETLINLF